MLILNPAAMSRARQRPRCEWTGEPLPHGADPAHVFSRGSGGPEADWNLVSLSRAAHSSHHDGNEPLHCNLLAIVAQRHQCLQGDIEAAVWALRRLPNDPSPERLKRELAAIPRRAAELVREAIAGHQPGSRKLRKRKWPKGKMG